MRSVTTRFAGLVILIAGIWGGLIPFVGPYFHFVLGTDHTWTWSADRLYLDVLPGAAAAIGGLMLLGGGPRAFGRLGALFALAGGIWFAVGPDVSRLWHLGGAQGAVHGAKGTRMLEVLTFHSGLGALVITLAAYSLPGLVALRSRAAAPAAVAPAAATRRRGLLRRRRPRAERDAVPAGAAAPAEAAPAAATGGRGLLRPRRPYAERHAPSEGAEVPEGEPVASRREAQASPAGRR